MRGSQFFDPALQDIIQLKFQIQADSSYILVHCASRVALQFPRFSEAIARRSFRFFGNSFN